MRNKIYSDFLTNLAVAWFAGGIIAPLMNGSINSKVIFLGLVALTASILSLYFAATMNKGRKNDSN